MWRNESHSDKGSPILSSVDKTHLLLTGVTQFVYFEIDNASVTELMELIAKIHQLKMHMIFLWEITQMKECGLNRVDSYIMSERCLQITGLIRWKELEERTSCKVFFSLFHMEINT